MAASMLRAPGALVRRCARPALAWRAASTSKPAKDGSKAVLYYPTIAGASLRPEVPIRVYAEHVKMDAGDERFWCACGYSDKQPWCDGSHRKRLVELRMQGAKVKNDYLQVDPGTYPICNCKYTDNPPFCDESCQKF